MIQIRDVPEELHRELRVRATRDGVTLSGYVLRLVQADLARPSLEEVVERIASRQPLGASATSSDLVREDRDRR